MLEVPAPSKFPPSYVAKTFSCSSCCIIFAEGDGALECSPSGCATVIAVPETGLGATTAAVVGSTSSSVVASLAAAVAVRPTKCFGVGN